MNRQRRKGFTLIELLIVILIIAILIALLMPALASAWYTAYTTECKTHLKIIYQASVVLRNNDLRLPMFPVGLYDGSAWVPFLLPYVENNMAVFTCPAALPPKTPSGTASTGGGSTTPSTGGTGGGSGTPGDSSGGTPDIPWSALDKPPDTPYVQFAFDIYSTRYFSSANYIWSATITSPWARSVRTGPNTWRYGIEDLGHCGGGDMMFEDIDVEVTYVNGLPSQVKLVMEDTDHAYGYDMTVNGAIVVHYVDDHRGKIVKLTSSADGTAPGSGQTPGSPGGQTVSIDSDGNFIVGGIPGLASGVALKPSNYGLNKGTYDVANLNITKPDAKLIFILDHHELVVDAFVDFDKYFIDTSTPNGLTNWISGWGKDGADWREYQSLRHFSQANVLFCDGHIESLGYERLEPYTIPETGAPPNRVIWK